MRFKLLPILLNTVLVASTTTLLAQSGNMGVGTATPGSKLTVNGSFAATYKKVTASYTLGITDYYLAVESASTTTITLPIVATASPSIKGRVYYIKNTGTGIVTIDGNGAEMLDNQTGAPVANFTLAGGEYTQLVCTGVATVSATTSQWEVATVSSGTYVEPWYNHATAAPATSNTQNIYQKGRITVGSQFDYGNGFTLVGNTALGDDIRIKSFGNVSPNLVFDNAAGAEAAPANVTYNTPLGGILFDARVNGVNSYLLSNITSTYKGDGTNLFSDLAFSTTATSRMLIDSGGRVGINTISPNYKLDVQVADSGDGIAIGLAQNSNNAQWLNFRKARGTIGSPSVALNGDALGTIAWSPYNGTSYTQTGSMRAVSSEAHSPTAMGTELQFWTTPNGSNTISQKAVLNESGNFGIGNTTPGSKLTINGSFAAAYKKVTTSYTLGITDYYLAVESAGATTITLPAAATASPSIKGRIYNIKNTGTGTVSINGNGAEMLDNQSGAPVATITLAAGGYAQLVCTGVATVSTATSQWEVATIGSGSGAYAGPWYDHATLTPATSNTQNIYQKGHITVGSSIDYGSGINLVGSNGASAFLNDIVQKGFGDSPYMIMERNQGTEAAPANLSASMLIGQIGWRGRINGGVPFTSVIRSTYLGNGNNNFSNLEFTTSGSTTKMIIDSVGQVGINNTTPDHRLNVLSPNAGDGIAIDLADNTGNAQWLNFRKARGVVGAPSFALNGDALGTIAWSPYNGTSYTQTGALRAAASEAHSTAAMGTELQFWVTPNGSNILSQKAVLNESGNFGIGSVAPGSRLTVNGSFGAIYKKVGASYTLGVNDYYLAVESAVATTVTLPVAATASPSIKGRIYNIKNTGTGTVTIEGNGAERLDNQSGAVTTITLAPGEYTQLICTGVATVSATTSQWEVAVVGTNNYIEPWYNHATLTPATANTQNIYQKGRITIGSSTDYGSGFTLVGTTGAGDDMRIKSFGNSPNLIFDNADGTEAAPTNVPYNTTLGNILFGARVNAASVNVSRISGTYKGNGTNLFSDMSFATTNATRMYIDSLGRIGINTANPDYRLDVQSPGANDGIAVDFSSSTNAAQSILFRKSRGTAAAPALAVSGDALGNLSWQPYNGTTYMQTGMIRAVAAETHSATGMGTELQFWNTANGTTALSQKAVLDENGNFGIGNNTPGSKFTVNGSFSAAYKKVTTSYALGITDYYLAVESAGTSTITLPVAATASPSIKGRLYNIKNTGTGPVIIEGNGAERLDNQSGVPVVNITLAAGEYTQVVCTGVTTVSGTTSQWEVTFVGSGTYVEPWYNHATLAPATANTQNIYQKGRMTIGSSTDYGSGINLVGSTPSGDDIRIKSFNGNTPNLIFDNADNTEAAPANVPYNTTLGNILFGARVNGATLNLSRITGTYKGNGTNLFSDMSFATTNGTKMYIDSLGRVGINTTSPDYKLDVQAAGANDGVAIDFSSSTATSQSLLFRKTRGSTAAPAFAASGDALGNISWSPYNGTTYTQTGLIRAVASETHSATAMGTELQFWNTAVGTTTLSQKAVLDENGNFGIGNNTPGSKLTVNGSFGAAYKKVTTSYALGITDYYLAVESAGATTITLPAAATANPSIKGRLYNIKNTGTGTVTIEGNGAERLDSQTGAVTNISLAPNEYTQLVCTGVATVSTTTAQWEVAIVGTSLAPANNPWSFNGNAGTVQANNFLGTVDNQNVNFRRNNIAAGSLATTGTAYGVGAGHIVSGIPGGSGTTAMGVNALSVNTANSNTAIGSAALSSNTTGANNTALGANALDANTTANNNTAIGRAAMAVNSTGGNNTAIGANALDANTTASNNTAVGNSAMTANTIGANNTAIGANALDANINANNNTAVGSAALTVNTTGSDNTAIGANTLAASNGDLNTAIGSSALASNTTGFSNTSIGNNAGENITTGYRNTAIGYKALNNVTTGQHNISIGYRSGERIVDGSGNIFMGRVSSARPLPTIPLLENIVIGNDAGNSLQGITNIGGENVIIGNDAGTTLTSGRNNVIIGYQAEPSSPTVNNQIQLGGSFISSARVQVPWTITSDKRYKTGIRNLPFGLNLIKELQPVDYLRIGATEDGREMGFIAQDVEKALQKIGYTDQGFLTKDAKGYYSIRYNDFTALTVNAIKEQQAQIEEMKATITSLVDQLKQLQQQLDKNKSISK